MTSITLFYQIIHNFLHFRIYIKVSSTEKVSLSLQPYKIIKWIIKAWFKELWTCEAFSGFELSDSFSGFFNWSWVIKVEELPNALWFIVTNVSGANVPVYKSNWMKCNQSSKQVNNHLRSGNWNCWFGMSDWFKEAISSVIWNNFF